MRRYAVGAEATATGFGPGEPHRERRRAEAADQARVMAKVRKVFQIYFDNFFRWLSAVDGAGR